jgi:hypothetical protein
LVEGYLPNLGLYTPQNSIAWGLNPRLLKMKVGNKLLNIITFFLGSPYNTFRMTDHTKFNSLGFKPHAIENRVYIL